MKKSLPLLIGSILCANAVLNGLGAVTTFSPHASSFQKIFGISVAHAEEAAAVKYTCPMHPQIISDTPGKCPICGMDLVQISASGGSHAHEEKIDESAMVTDQKDRKILYWYDPMVPEKRFDKPGKSPFMDMELVPKYADEVQSDASGKPVISINADTVQKMGVRMEKVTKGSFAQTIRATAIVTENERSRWDLFSQVEGRVEDLRYSAAGDRVKKGDLFYTLYSPELLSLQNDFIAARKAGLQDLAQAAKKRMKLLGVDEKVIADLSKTGKAFEKVPFYIPADGILARLEIRNGHYLKMNDEIGHIQDLSTVWLEAAVPEKDLSSIKEGDIAEIAIGPQKYEGKVDYIYPTIDSEARIGKVRVVVENKDGLLRPASYASINFSSGQAAEQVTVPSEAVLRNSEGEHVIVALGSGKFQARSIKTGGTSAGRTEIVSGLQEGDDVVVSAQFLIDSESSLQESLGKLSGGQ
ncbi:MAG: efflux RND transporter periplasmic adaptor subunit [Dongiaceae bacterium]|jgi:Cu(I)/Ag(I) efflux system membrane fusion protein